MLEHHPKLKKLATRNGKADGRKMRSKAFLEELSRIVAQNPPDEGILDSIFERKP